MTTKPHPAMSEYEAAAWTKLIDYANKADTGGLRPLRAAQRAIGRASDRASAFIDDHERVSAVIDTALTPLEGLNRILTDAATATVRDQGVVRRAQRKDASISALSDIRARDLSVPDSLIGKPGLRYGVALGAEGAASALAITGLTVSSTVSGGTTLVVAVGAVAADVVTNLGAAARVVAVIATSYGYDLNEPDEQLYASGVLSYGSAGSAAGKTASLAQLSRLTQTMMRHATHEELSKFVVVKVTQQVFKALGFKATHQKLAQAVPVVGAVYNAGLNATAIQQVVARAQHAYRLRFLTEKYEMDPADWLTGPNEASSAGEAEIDIEQLLEEIKAEEEGS